MNTDETHDELREGWKQALAVALCWETGDFTGATDLHDIALADEATLPLVQALAFLFVRSLPGTHDEKVAALQADLARLASVE